MTCSDPDCQKEARARGMCGLHYGRWYRKNRPFKNCKIEGCKNNQWSKGLCNTHYAQQWVYQGDGAHGKYETLAEAFEGQTALDPGSGCLLWTGATQKGYGQLAAENTAIAAHRYAYEQTHGPIPDGKVIDHICHTPQCVNGLHLRAVTHAQNLRHRKGANSNNKLGVRNVHWDSAKKKYLARVTHNGETLLVGNFDDLDEAEAAVTAKRKELWGNHAGA